MPGRCQKNREPFMRQIIRRCFPLTKILSDIFRLNGNTDCSEEESFSFSVALYDHDPILGHSYISNSQCL